METKTENYKGSDCTGNDGDKNRTLTISNTGATTNDGFLVYVSGLALAKDTEYSVTHKSSGTVITFLNRLWDDMTIIVQYIQTIGGTAEDFVNGPLSDFGVDVTRTIVTVETDFEGNKKYTDGSTETIKVVVVPYSKEYRLDEAGLTQEYDLVIFYKSTDTLNKYDKLTVNGREYRVDRTMPRYFDGNLVFNKAYLFYI